MRDYIHRLVVRLFDKIVFLYKKFMVIELSKYETDILYDEIHEEFESDLGEIHDLLEKVEGKVLDKFNSITSK